MNIPKVLKNIILIMLIALVTSGTVAASLWIGDMEIGLAEWQDSGYVAGIYIERPTVSNTALVYYIPESNRKSPDEKMYFRFQRSESFDEYHTRLSEEVKSNNINKTNIIIGGD